MKKLGLLITGVAVIAISLLPKGTAKAATAITNCTELQAMSSNLAETYTLANDIDCSATTGWNSGDGFEQVGNNATKFTGTLDGQNYKINNLFINRPGTNNIGLFGWTTNASISNLYLNNVSIRGNVYTGGLIGGADGAIQINNVHVSGAVTGGIGTGGLVGALYAFDEPDISNIFKASNTAVVTGTNYVGGLVGDTGPGDASVLLISQSFNSGNITSSGVAAGGIIGYSQYGDDNTTLLNSYNSGNVTATSDKGGLFGVAYLTDVSKSYSSGLVAGTDAATNGALIGLFDVSNDMFNSFWNTETSGQSGPCGTAVPCPEKATGLSTAQMRTQSTFTEATWDFENVWGICESFNNGFPYLLWQNPTCTTPSDTPGLPNTGFGNQLYPIPFI